MNNVLYIIFNKYIVGNKIEIYFQFSVFESKGYSPLRVKCLRTRKLVSTVYNSD